MMKNHDPKACPECTAELAQKTAKKLAEHLTLHMEEVLSGMDDLVHADNDIFQGQVCHLLAAFILSHSIKILQIRKMPVAAIDEMCTNCIEMAHDFCKAGKFKKVEKH